MRSLSGAMAAWRGPGRGPAAPDADIGTETGIAAAPEAGAGAGRVLVRRRNPAPRRDPAPSRLSYRWQRLWLTPMFRAGLRIGLPLALIGGALAGALADEGRRAQATGLVADLRAWVEQRPEFMVTHLAIDGASPALAAAIRGALDLGLPASSFAIDLAAARATVEGFDAVARADLAITSGGVLNISVTERRPAAVWRTAEGLWLLDAEGRRVATVTARGLRPDLPLIAGEGAEAAVPEALALVAAAGPLTPRLRGLVRVGARRWDVVLEGDQTILLPAAAPVRALERVIALDQAEGLLLRDVRAVDLRVPARATLRLSPGAAEALRETRRSAPSEARL
jgi:cell division protein FtsQ